MSMMTLDMSPPCERALTADGSSRQSADWPRHDHRSIGESPRGADWVASQYRRSSQTVGFSPLTRSQALGPLRAVQQLVSDPDQQTTCVLTSPQATSNFLPSIFEAVAWQRNASGLPCRDHWTRAASTAVRAQPPYVQDARAAATASDASSQDFIESSRRRKRGDAGRIMASRVADATHGRVVIPNQVHSAGDGLSIHGCAARFRGRIRATNVGDRVAA